MRRRGKEEKRERRRGEEEMRRRERKEEGCKELLTNFCGERGNTSKNERF